MGLVSKFVGLSPHLRLALVIAPLLTVGGYVLVDMYEEADAPDEQVFRLVSEGECRLSSGVPCKFSGMGLDVLLEATPSAEGGTRLDLDTSLAVRQVMLEAVGSASVPPSSMAGDGKGLSWSKTLPHSLSSYDELHVVFSTRRAFLFLETEVR